MLAACSQSASALETREFKSQITTVPATGPHAEEVPLPGKLSGVNSLAVDAGTLYAAEVLEGRSESRIDRFDASTGAFEAQLPQIPGIEGLQNGLAVGHATGAAHLYAGASSSETAEGVVAVLDAEGNLLSTWEGRDTSQGGFGTHGVSAVAAEGSLSGNWASGDVFVADEANDAIYAFNPTLAGKPGEETAPVAELTEVEPGVKLAFSESPEPALAVDGFNGDVLVADGGHAVDVLEPTGVDEFTLIRRITEGPSGPFQLVTGVTADPSTGDILVADRNADVVYEFDREGNFVNQISETTASAFESVQGIAVDPASEQVFIGDRRTSTGVIDVFGAPVVVPDVTTAAATEVGALTATLNGTVSSDGEGEASCAFVWGTTRRFGSSTPCSAMVPGGPPPVSVQAQLSGLEPDTTYFYRLQATNLSNGKTNSGNATQDHEFETSGPGLQAASATKVTADGASLGASIDPDGAPTRYYFQYGTEECATAAQACQAAPAPPGVAIGSGTEAVEVVPQSIEGLAAGTLYHYRVVAVSELTPGTPETFFGHDHTFTTQGTVGLTLPDSREWELVSPPDKHGASLEPVGNGALIQAAANGSAISYAANAPTESAPQGSANLVQVLAGRGPSGWASRDIAIPHETASGPAIGAEGEYRFFSEDLAGAIVQPFGAFDAQLSSEASEPTAYLASDYLDGNPLQACSSSCFTPLATADNVSPPGTRFGEEYCALHGGTELYCGPKFVGATPDLSHVVLQSTVALTEGGGSGGDGGLYEWSAGTLKPVSVLPGESGAGVPAQLGFRGVNARHAVSSDGSRVIWEAETGSVRHLYLRDTAHEETVQLDVALPGAPSGSEPAPEFQDASSDGSKVFFTDTEALTEESRATSGRPDLYECEVQRGPSGLECQLKDLTPSGTGESAADVLGTIPGVSEDGSYVYFVADGVLAPGAENGTCEGAFAPNATCSLYLEHEGTTKLIATLAGTDSPDWASGEAALARLTSRTSPNGKWLAFMSNRSLTGYDNRDSNSGQPDEEVYEYDATAAEGTGATACVSCSPSGGRPVGVEYGSIGENMPLVGTAKIWETDSWFAALIPGWSGYSGFDALHQPRYLADNGRLFFNSRDSLSSTDTNETWDVYEFEPTGTGDCQTALSTFSARSNGCIGLISSGLSAEESALLDASASGGRDAAGEEGGGDVFFLTAAKLSKQDFDTGLDVYDAHECTTSSPCLSTTVASQLPCTSEASCKPPPSPPPTQTFAPPPSSGSIGEGNLQPVKPATSKPVKLTRAQKLTRALKTCRKKPKGKARKQCEKTAHKHYDPLKPKKSKPVERRTK
jgi:WD40-like Beta Propeller Repeat